MKNKYDFENYLQEKHMAQYEGLDDEAPDDYENWITELCVHEWIEYAEAYARIISLSEPH